MIANQLGLPSGITQQNWNGTQKIIMAFVQG